MIARAYVIGVALFGLAALVELALFGRFWEWTLPLGLAVGLVIARRSHPHVERPFRGLHGPNWVFVGAAILLVATGAALTYGALATPARHWDGIVSWEPKAAFLARTPSLAQPFFSGDGVYAHTLDYPLLQPLAIAAGARLAPGAAPVMAAGRAFFPLCWLATVLVVGVAVRRQTAHGGLAIASALAVGLTPALVNPTMGGVDSGFADAPFALGIAAITAAIACRDRWLFAASIAFCVLLKPEGMVFGALALAIVWAGRARALLWFGTLSYAIACGLWLPIQRRLVIAEAGGDGAMGMSTALGWALLGGLCIAVMGSDALFERLRLSTRTRVLTVVIGAPALALALPLCISAFSSGAGTFDVYLDDLDRPLQRLGRLPSILAHLFERSIFRFRFGTTFVLLAATVVVHGFAGRRRGAKLEAGTATAAAFVLLGCASLVTPFLLSPEADLEHHVKSSMTRLLLHWSGAAWIVGTCVVTTRRLQEDVDEPALLSADR